MGLKDAGQIGSIVDPPDQPRRRLARGARVAVRAERRARHLQDDRRRQDVEEDAVRQRRDRRPRRRGQLREPERALCRHVSRLPQGLGHHFRRSRDAKAASTSRSTAATRGRSCRAACRRRSSARSTSASRAASRRRSTRWWRRPAARAGCTSPADAGAIWKLVNGAANLRTRPFYFHYVDVNPKDPNEVWVSSLTFLRSRDGGVTFSAVPTPHVDNHGIWFNPDNPSYAIQANDGGANVTTDGGRTWSSILNQPTAELYMVAVDQQHPYLLYAPQQDNSTVVVPSVPTGVVRLRSSGAGLHAGVGLRDRRHLADAGRPRRLGRVQGRGRAPQRPDRSGAGPLDLPAGSLRPSSRRDQVPVPAADRDHALAARPEDRLPGVARPAPFDRRRRDVAGDQPGPHRAREGVSGRAGTADHARRHRRGGLFDASTRWPSRRSSAA